jgi:flagellar hook-associated protein 2
LAGYTDTQAVSSSGFVNLVVGSRTYSLNLTGTDQNNVQGLADAINNSGAGAGASVFTSGSTNYLVLTTNNSGATTLQLNDVSTADLVSNNGTGTETSLATYPDATTAPVSANGQVMLTVGSNTYNLDVSANNNLTGLADAINSSGAGITATVTGFPTVPGFPGSYSLSLVHAGATSIQLNDVLTPTALVSSTNQGSDASYKLNGVQETSSSNNVSGVISGVSFTLNKLNAGSVTLSLASSGSQLSNTLQGLVTSYNALVTQVQAQQGPSAGPLGGDLLINQISGDMQQLVTYYNPTTTSSIRSLSDLGITFNYSGQLSFDPTVISGLTDTQVSDAFNGSSSTGLGALASNFTQLTDPISGLIQTEEAGLNRANTNLTSQIATLNAKVALIQANATREAQQGDALVAQLQSQQTTVDASIQGLNSVLYGRQTNANGL